MNEDRFVLSDEIWLKIEPLLQGKSGDRGATGADNRLFMEALLWRVRTGSPWRDLPRGFGCESRSNTGPQKRSNNLTVAE